MKKSLGWFTWILVLGTADCASKQQAADFSGPAQRGAMASGFVPGSDMYFEIGNDAAMANLRDFWRARPRQ